MTKKLRSIRERLLDAADLMIDFATLGEYGLEPCVAAECESPPPPQLRGSACGAAAPALQRRTA